MIFSVDAYCFILHKVLHGHLDILLSFMEVLLQT